MITFKEFLLEAGAVAGKMELATIPLDKARTHAEKVFKTYNKDLNTEIPNFDKNFKIAQKAVQQLQKNVLRKDMPVLDQKDIKDFQKKLLKGSLDINSPFAKKDAPFLDSGLKIHDGNEKDDIVDVKMIQVPVGKLKPIQKQIYFDKSIKRVAQDGAQKSKAFVTSKIFVISSDNYIIDGHHRFLSGILNDATMKVKCLQINLPLDKLLKVSLDYSDAVGNVRNN